MSANLPRLSVNEIADQYIRKNFERLRDFLRVSSPLLGFEFFSPTFKGAVTKVKIPHNLGYQPQDIIQTSVIGAGTVTFHYDLFDAMNLVLSTTDACAVRFFAGTYQEGPS